MGKKKRTLKRKIVLEYETRGLDALHEKVVRTTEAARELKEELENIAFAPTKAETNALLNAPTRDLADELARRPGCLTLAIEPNGRGTIGVDGPATCIVVLD